MEEREPCVLLVKVYSAAIMEISIKVPQNIKNRTTIHPGNYTSDYFFLKKH